MPLDALPEDFHNQAAGTGTDCILWKGAVAGQGYGYINRNNKVWRVHRWVYTQHFGEIPEGMFVCHHCDVRLCINPKHLFLGTPLTNMQDMIRKGRAKHPPMKGIPQNRKRRHYAEKRAA